MWFDFHCQEGATLNVQRAMFARVQEKAAGLMIKDVLQERDILALVAEYEELDLMPKEFSSLESWEKRIVALLDCLARKHEWGIYYGTTTDENGDADGEGVRLSFRTTVFDPRKTWLSEIEEFLQEGSYVDVKSDIGDEFRLIVRNGKVERVDVHDGVVEETFVVPAKAVSGEQIP